MNPNIGSGSTPPAESTLPEGFLKYLKARDKERADTVLVMWNKLTERERLLVKEAAVMGYVQGKMRHDLPIPNDGDVVRLIFDAVRAHDDLYPTLAALDG